MTEPIDIWRSARLLMTEHGERAPEIAARRVSELVAQGNDKGAAVWGDIVAAIASLRSRQQPPAAVAN